jgi:hypothetical protein
MRSRTRTGQIFIIVLIILVIVVVLFLALPLIGSRSRPTPLVQQVLWNVGGRNVTSCFLNQEVEVHVTIESAQLYVASVEIKIRKDVSLWFDSDYATKTFPVNMPGGQSTELVFTFAPDEASEGQLHGYFVEVDFLTSNSNWIMENSYPPRLTVAKISPGGSTPV